MKTCLVLIAAAVALEFSYQQLLAGKVDTTGTIGKVEAQLANLNSIMGTSFRLSYALGAAGAYCYWKNR